MKRRNPIARVIRRIRHHVILDKRDKLLDEIEMFDTLDEMELQAILREIVHDNRE